MEEVVKVSLRVDGKEIVLAVKKDTTVRRKRYYTVVKNPYCKFYHRQILYGSTPDIIVKKAYSLIDKWRKRSEAGECQREEKRREEYQKTLQQSGEADSLPFY